MPTDIFVSHKCLRCCNLPACSLSSVILGCHLPRVDLQLRMLSIFCQSLGTLDKDCCSFIMHWLLIISCVWDIKIMYWLLTIACVWDIKPIILWPATYVPLSNCMSLKVLFDDMCGGFVGCRLHLCLRKILTSSFCLKVYLSLISWKKKTRSLTRIQPKLLQNYDHCYLCFSFCNSLFKHMQHL